MPLVETDLLKAYLDPADDLHKASLKAFELLAKGGGMALSSASLLELDLVLKSSGFSVSEREEVFRTLQMRLVKARIAPLTPEALRNAIAIQRSYEMADFYFDSLHIGMAMCGDCTIISSDDAFDKIKQVTRIDPRGL